MSNIADNKRFYPVDEAEFGKSIEPIIIKNYIWKGRPPKISHYNTFCAILYILRTGIPWRDLPEIFGNWNTVFRRFSRWSENGLLWKILMTLQSQKLAQINVILADSTAFKVHRHGGGLKGGSKAREKQKQE